MFTTTVRGMLAHRLRLALTTASIALGIAFLAGTLILTDTMQRAFDNLFGSVSAGTDVVVRQHNDYAGGAAGSAPVRASVADTVRMVPGVRAAADRISGYALLTDTQGKAIPSAGGAPTLGLSMPADVGLRGEVRMASGRAPSGPGEVAIDATSARRRHLAPGDRIRILFRGPAETFTVVGTVRFGADGDLGGSTCAYFDPITAQRVLGSPGQVDAIDVSAEPGIGQEALARQLAAVLPPGVEAVTARQAAQEASDAARSDLGFFSTMLMVFAGIALFVGSFIIWNTFTMIVSQRTREIALLRAIGATRRQVLRSLLLEAVLLGAGSSLAGVGLGAGVARGLTALMGLLGFSLPSAAVQVHWRTVWVSLLVGTVVTVVAALVPARRATRVRPVEALRDAVPGSPAPTRLRATAGVALTGAGVGALFLGLYGQGGMALVGLGVVGAVLGVSVLAPLAARPLAAVAGRPLSLRGVPGELARQNAMRNPRRTAATAAALMIGLTMVVSMGIFASSLKASTGDVLGGSTRADLFLARSSIMAPGFSTETTQTVADVPGVATISPSGWGEARFAGGDGTYSAVDPATAQQVLNLDVSAGSVSALANDDVVVSRKAARSHAWTVGSLVPVQFPNGDSRSLTVVGIFDRKGYIDTDYLVSLELHRQVSGIEALDTSALILVDEGVDVQQVKHRIDDALAAHPDARILDEQEYRQVAGGFVDQLLTFVLVMLLLAVVIALLGVVNTLALSVFERTRELGLLRAIGMTRAQVRAMVRWEAAVISLVGSAAGAVLGIGLGIALVRAVRDVGITVVSVPGAQVGVYVALATLAGFIAAVGPARRADGVNLLRAVVVD